MDYTTGGYFGDESAVPDGSLYGGDEANEPEAVYNDVGSGGDGVQGWVELRCVAAGGPSAQLIPDALRCLALHPTRELIYAGTASGFLHSHSIQDSVRITSARPDPAGVRDADPAVRDAVVVALPGVNDGESRHGGQDAVITACASGVVAVTRGCAPLARIDAASVAGAAAVARNPANDAQVAAGGTSSLLAVLDWPGQRIIRQAALRGGNNVTCAEWADISGVGSLAMFATATGRVSVCDPSSMREVNAAAGFAGPVTSMAVRGPLIAASGMSMRGGISFFEQAIKLFDVRAMHQPLASVPFPAGAACLAFDEWVSSTITGGEALWALSTDGVLQCLEVSGLQSGQGVIPVSNEIHLDAENDSFTALAVSPDGLVICGDTGGFLHQWSATEHARLNSDSEPLWESDLGPPIVTPPKPNFHLRNLMNSDVGSTIPMSVLPVERGMLSDQFVDSIGSQMARDFAKGTSSRGGQKQGKPRTKVDSLGCGRPPFSRFPPVVAATIIESANWHDFVAYAQAQPGFIRNSLFSGHELPPLVPHLGRQGRDLSSSPKGSGSRFGLGTSPSSRYRSSPSPPGSLSQPPGSLAGVGEFKLNPTVGSGLLGANVDAVLMTPAGRSSYVEMDLVAWESVEGFDFLRYNQSGMFCGLENALPNVYVNAAIQSLYFTPPFRSAIAHHSCEQDTCISCELSFLFKMLDVGGAGVAVETGNFTKAFMKMANAGALGLLDGSTALPLAARIESFVSYLLEQLHKDAGGDDSTVVSRLTGANVLSFGKFSPSMVEWQRESRPFQHTLCYDDAPADFPALVQASLYRKMDPTRAFCSASGAFETMSQTRRLTSLPNLLVLGANSKAPGFASWWLEGNSKRQSRSAEDDANHCAEHSMASEARLCAGLRLEIDEKTQELSVSELEPSHNSEPELSKGTKSDAVRDRFATAYDAEPLLSSAGVANEADACAEADANAAANAADIESSEFVAEYELSFVIARAAPTSREAGIGSESYVRDGDGHLVTYVRVPGVYRSAKTGNHVPDLKSMAEWWCFNDFVIAPCEAGWKEVASFSAGWKTPCLFGYVRRDVATRVPPLGRPMPANLREIIGSEACNAAVGISSDESPPGPGTPLGLDCEFVMVEREDCEITPDGRRTVVTPARMALARVSLVRGAGEKLGVPLIDDYVEAKEPVVDYLTRFSGVSAGDLDPGRSPYTVRPLKTVYKKLLALVEAGVVFVGHGLKKDLRVLNFAVPAQQVVDTVVLFRDPEKRLLSLRFLVGTLLGSDIQTGGSDGHDSVEDALAAVRLFGAHEELQERGVFAETLRNLYSYGYQHGWKVNSEQPFSITG